MSLRMARQGVLRERMCRSRGNSAPPAGWSALDTAACAATARRLRPPPLVPVQKRTFHSRGHSPPPKRDPSPPPPPPPRTASKEPAGSKDPPVESAAPEHRKPAPGLEKDPKAIRDRRNTHLPTRQLAVEDREGLVDVNMSPTWQKSAIPWKPKKSDRPGPGTYSVERATLGVKSSPNWSFGARRSVKKLHMPWYPEKDFGKHDTPWYDEHPPSTRDYNFGSSSRDMVMVELVSTPSGERPLRDFRFNRTPCCTTYGVPDDTVRQHASPKFSFARGTKEYGSCFAKGSKNMVGPGTYNPNEVLTSARVKAPAMGAPWSVYEKVNINGLEAAKFCRDSPGHEYTPVLQDSVPGGAFATARTGRAYGERAPGSKPPDPSGAWPGPCIEELSSLRTFSSRSLNPPGGPWPEIREEHPVRFPAEKTLTATGSLKDWGAY